MEAGVDLTKEQMFSLASRLQRAHDNASMKNDFIDSYERNMANVAKQMNLNYTSPQVTKETV